MAVALQYINAALTRTGNEAITSLMDGSPGANIAAQNYELIVRDALASHPWRWATKTATLSMITGSPDEPWLYAYQLPTDLVSFRTVMTGGLAIDFEIQGTRLLSNYDSSSELVLTYVWFATEDLWPGWFAEAITQRLEVLFLRGIGERYAEAVERERSAEVAMRRAKYRDALGRTPRDPVISGTLRARGGSGTWDALYDLRVR